VGRFTRDAPWIRRIFPPSSTPATRQPSAVSEDIQLTQDYLAWGQTQDAVLWLSTFDFGNPGIGANVAIIDPSAGTMGPIPTEPEVWRVFFMSLQIPGTPASDFTFSLQIGITNPTLAVTFSEFAMIDIAQGEPTQLYPICKTQSQGVPPTLTTPGYGQSSPLLLPFNPDQAPAHGPTVQLVQHSAQVVSTETLRVVAYIMRNPRGVAHVL